MTPSNPLLWGQTSPLPSDRPIPGCRTPWHMWPKRHKAAHGLNSMVKGIQQPMPLGRSWRRTSLPHFSLQKSSGFLKLLTPLHLPFPADNGGMHHPALMQSHHNPPQLPWGQTGLLGTHTPGRSGRGTRRPRRLSRCSTWRGRRRQQHWQHLQVWRETLGQQKPPKCPGSCNICGVWEQHWHGWRRKGFVPAQPRAQGTSLSLQSLPPPPTRTLLNWI